MRECCPSPIIRELTSKAVHTIASEHNGEVGFGQIEADFLYAFVATKKPRQIFQIGCGVSTAVCQMAAQDAGYQPEVICVEPYPTQYLLREANAGRITLLREKVELLDLRVVEDLGADLLFVVDLQHGVTRMKLSFFDSGPQDRYAEVYINVDADNRVLGFHEKDKDYRKALLLALTQGLDAKPPIQGSH